MVHHHDGLRQTGDPVRALGTNVPARILEPVTELERRIGQGRDAARLDLGVVQLLLIAPAAELAEAQLPARRAFGSGDDRAERGAERHVDMGSRGVPFTADPCTAVEDEDDVIAAMAVPSHDHARLVVHVRREKIRPDDRPLLTHARDAAVGIALLLHGCPFDVVDVPKGRLDAVELR